MEWTDFPCFSITLKKGKNIKKVIKYIMCTKMINFIIKKNKQKDNSVMFHLHMVSIIALPVC